MSDKDAHLMIASEGEIAVVRFANRKILEEIAIAEIGEQLTTLADSHEGIKMLVDFENVEHLSSAVLSMLINLSKQVGERGGQLKLANIRPQIYEVFKITRLNEVFDIYDSTIEAKKSY
jgi:anti-sigma B factor antagonist